MNEIYSPVSSFLLSYRGEWHVRYEADLVKYAAVINNKYGVEVLRGCGKNSIMNVFLLNNGGLVDRAKVGAEDSYKGYDYMASKLIDYNELIDSLAKL